jgi:hypothetical protein
VDCAGVSLAIMQEAKTGLHGSEPEGFENEDGAPQHPKHERPFLSREETASIFYGSLFAILAIGCFVIVGWF